MSNVYIKGGNGFLGRHLTNLFGVSCPIGVADLGINAAGKVAGIAENKANPAVFFDENFSIGSEFLRGAWYFGIKKVVQMNSVCAYPLNAPIPTKESDYWNGEPEITNSGYGHAKRALLAQAQAYSRQYGMNIINPVLANLYGPGDHYGDRAHVIPDMIHKFSTAALKGDRVITLWGSGECSREFLYVKDAAESIKFLSENYNSPEIINVATGNEIKIKDLANLVASICGFNGGIVWDKSKPDGQPRRKFDTSKLDVLGWTAPTRFEDGIANAVDDYKLRTKEGVTA